MKLIHCADLHLDSRMESNLSREQAAQRREELLATFVKMVDYAADNQVQAIILAGDVFDTAQNTQKRIKNRVLDQIRSHEDIDFLYLRGNHDKVDFFENLENPPANLKLFGDTWTTFSYKNSAEASYADSMKGSITDSMEASLRQIDITGCELNRQNIQTIYSQLALSKEHINIVVLHGQESHYERKNDGEIIPLSSLQNRYIDYLALGHIHSYKCARLDNRGIYCYSGCLEGRGFDECGEKGFVLLEISEDGSLTSTFCPIARRTLHEIPIPLSGQMSERDILTAIEAATELIPQKDLVKLILTGDVDETTDIDVKYLHSQLSSRFYFLKIYDETHLMIHYEDYANDISLKGEFVRMVQAQDMDEEEKNAIILLGLKALAGREIEL